MDSTSNAHVAMHSARQGLASLAKAIYLLLVVIPAEVVDAYGLKVVAWFAAAAVAVFWATVVAFWTGYDRADATALVSTVRDVWQPESWIVVVSAGAIWLTWNIARRRFDKK